MGLDEDEKRERMKHCRHKARYIRPSTPEHYWSINFPDTQEAEARGKCNFLDIFIVFPRDRVPTGEHFVIRSLQIFLISVHCLGPSLIFTGYFKVEMLYGRFYYEDHGFLT